MTFKVTFKGKLHVYNVRRAIFAEIMGFWVEKKELMRGTN